MSKQSAENYLDELLNSVNGEKKAEAPAVEETMIQEESASDEMVFQEEEQVTLVDEADLDDILDEGPSSIRTTAKAEAEFLMEFEQELAGDDFQDFLKDFEENMIQPEDRLAISDIDSVGDPFASLFGDLPEESLKMEEEHIEEPTDSLSLEELALNGMSLDELSMAEPLPDEEPDLSQDSGVSPAEAIDLGQLGEEDLLNLLAGSEDLSDIGALLSKSENEEPVEAVDLFAAFAENEMEASTENNLEEASKANKKGKTKNKKGGFLEKLTALLFGPEKEEKNTVDLSASAPVGVEELTDENAQILATFAEADALNLEDRSGQKPKKGKEKKKKAPKEKVPAKQKAPKAPKAPKPKKPKVVDNTPPLPKGPVALVLLMAASLFVLIFFGSEMLGYYFAVSEAKDLYKHGQYAEAANKLSGLEIKEDDAKIYGKIVTLAAVDSELSAYRTFWKNDNKPEALDSLISAAGRCEVNAENAVSFSCEGQLDTMKTKISDELEENFGISYEEAIALYELTYRDRDKYTITLGIIIEELGLVVEE